MALIRSISIAPVSTHTQTLLAGAVYGADFSGAGGFARIRLLDAQTGNLDNERVRTVLSPAPLSSHTRTLLAGAVYGVDFSAAGAWCRIDFLIYRNTSGGVAFQSDGVGETSWIASQWTSFRSDGRSIDTWGYTLVAGRWAGSFRSDGIAETYWSARTTGDATFRSDGQSKDEWLARSGAIAESCLAGDGDFDGDESGAGGGGGELNYVF